MTRFVIPTIFSAVDQFSRPVDKMRDSLLGFTGAGANLQRQLKGIGDRAFERAKETGLAGAALLGPLAFAANEAISFHDRMADVAKTTGLAGAQLDYLGKDILKLSRTTSTTIPDLEKIAEVAGQLGIATKNLSEFEKAGNIFNVALGKDYAGGMEEAITSVGKLNMLFKDTKNLDPAASIMKIGSAINTLGAVGAGTSQNINDFMLRVGAMPAAFRPSATSAAALGTFLEEVGIDAQVGASGFSQLMLDASKNLAGFAAQMNITQEAAQKLMASDPSQFAADFSKSVKDLSATDAARVFKKLGIASNEELKVIGALGSGMERLNYLVGVSNKAFADGTSLAQEYAVKNNTVAAKLGIAKNNFQALAITIGTELLPIITKLLDKVMPVVSGIADWVGEHKKLTKVLLYSVGGLGLLLTGISLVNFGIAAVTKATWLWQAAIGVWNLGAGVMMGLLGTSGPLLMTSKAAFVGYTATTYAAAGAANYFSGSLTVLLAKIGLVTGGLALIIAYHKEIDQWAGQSKLGLFYDKFMAERGFIEGGNDRIKNSLLGRYKNDPAGTKQFIADHPDFAFPGMQQAMDSVDKVNANEAFMQEHNALMQAQLPELTRQADSMKNAFNQNVQITVNDNTKGGVTVSKGKGPVPVNVKSSFNWAGQ